MSKIFFPTIIYFSIAVSILQGWLWLAAGLIILFSLRYGAVALVPLAILIDGYFGNFYTMPYLSWATILWFVMVDIVRPKLLNLRSTS